MADPRFYDNVGPFTLADMCANAGVSLPDGANGAALVEDVASLTGAGPAHLSFYAGGAEATKQFAVTAAGYCFVASSVANSGTSSCLAIPCASVQHAFAAAALVFFLFSCLAFWLLFSA